MLRSSKGAASAMAEHARYSSRVSFLDVETELVALTDKAVAAIAASTPVPDAILGDYIGLASLIRSVSFHEGKLLEQAIVVIAERNPDLVVLSHSLKLPVTPAALEAIALNRGGTLRGLSFDADARTRVTYTPDLVVVNRRYHSATILDVKRSIASYIDTHRLTELKTKMLATSLILPDWLYKEHKRLMVDTVGIAIIDGSSAPSDHENGIWAMDEIDDLIEIEGAAETMAELRRRFGEMIRTLLSTEAQRLVDVETGPAMRMRLNSEGPPMPIGSILDDQVLTEAPGIDGVSVSWLASRDADDASGRTRNHFRAAAPHMPRTIRVGFARARLDA